MQFLAEERLKTGEQCRFKRLTSMLFGESISRPTSLPVFTLSPRDPAIYLSSIDSDSSLRVPTKEDYCGVQNAKFSCNGTEKLLVRISRRWDQWKTICSAMKAIRKVFAFCGISSTYTRRRNGLAVGICGQRNDSFGCIVVISLGSEMFAKYLISCWEQGH